MTESESVFSLKLPLPEMRVHPYRDERLLIRFAHPGLKSWAGARNSQAELLDADTR